MAGNPEFGKKIREKREELKRGNPAYSLRRFAQAIDVSPTFLSKVEVGEFDPPAAEKIKKMAELLKLDADELLALAKKVDPELNKIIREMPREMAAFLRTASGMSAERLKLYTQLIEQDKKEKGEK